MGFEQERGRENLGFPGVEVLKPQGFKDPPAGGDVRFPAPRHQNLKASARVLFVFVIHLLLCL